eukprot:2495769-Lingulodinium_polyedra.AAC.1
MSNVLEKLRIAIQLAGIDARVPSSPARPILSAARGPLPEASSDTSYLDDVAICLTSSAPQLLRDIAAVAALA